MEACCSLEWVASEKQRLVVSMWVSFVYSWRMAYSCSRLLLLLLLEAVKRAATRRCCFKISASLSDILETIMNRDEVESIEW